MGCNNIIDLEDHLNDLCGKFKLVLLGSGRFEDALLEHVGSALVISVNSDEGAGLTHLLFSDLRDVLDWGEAGVFGEGKGDFLKSVGKSAHCVLLNTLNLVSGLSNGDRASKLGSTTTSNDVVVLDHISHNTDSVMEATTGLITNDSGATSDEDGDSLRLNAILNQNNAVI